MNIAFAGFKHDHIIGLYNQTQLSEDTAVCGAWEAEGTYRISAQASGVQFTYETYEQLLSDEKVDIVAIGDQYGDRGKLIISALRAGKHVIADKPLCTSLAELDEIEALVQKTGKKVHCLYTLRYLPRTISVKNFIESGKLGKINNIYFGGQHPLQYGKRPGWYYTEKHGGVINDIAVHGIDLIRFMCGLEIEEVLAARCWNAYAEAEPGFLDSAQFMARFSGGAGLIADVSYASPNSQGYKLPLYWAFDIWGTKGVIRFSYHQEATAYLDGEAEGFILPDTEPPCDELHDFLSEIQGKMPKILDTVAVLASARDTLRVQAFSKPERI